MPPTEYPVVRLRDDSLTRGPWTYARQVEPADRSLEDGALVEVLDASSRFVGHGLWNGSSDVALRWLSRGRRSDLQRPREFLLRQIKAADDLRRRWLRLPEVTDGYRIVHGEGDDLPGLVIDRLGGALVVEHHALGFFRLRQEIDWALGQLYPGLPTVHRVPNQAAKLENYPPPLLEALDREPTPAPTEVTERGLRYPVRPGQGHKTGFFCDQRDNRRRVGDSAAGRLVYDLCCNSGGFALNAARAGARAVEAVDLDEVALDQAIEAGKLNRLAVNWTHADAFDWLRDHQDPARRADLVVLDPPKLATGRSGVEAALRKYLDLNTLALGAVRPGGFLFTFSCSGAVDLQGFLGTVFFAARRAERDVRLLEVLGAGPDHPQRPDFARSRYLKGAWLAVD
jgi:23S rRNA (cytosine1962-C5)-methyltransferase